MLELSFNLSVKLRENLDKIEALRRDILMIPLSSQKELQLRWDTTLTSIYYACSLEGRLIKKEAIEKILTVFSQKEQKRIEKDIVRYKKTLDYISQEWYVSRKAIKVDDITKLYETCSYGDLRVTKRELEDILIYLQNKEENPIIDAAVAIICFRMLKPFTEDNEKIALLMGKLMLYRQGYDFRGLFSIEALWSTHIISINQIMKTNLTHSNITLWLEEFSSYVLIYLQSIYAKLYSPVRTILKKTDFTSLNERQKLLLYAFSYPEAIITNRKVQELYKVSQITASRDLLKLTTLGLLSPHGKGRSVYYTKV